MTYTLTLTPLRSFAHHHDELPAFHAAYLVLTVLVAALLNLGFFALLIVAHMALDLIKYREVHGLSIGKTLRATIRESLFDYTLFTLGLLIAIYLHHSLPGIAGLSGILRSEVTIARGLGTLIPKAEILHRFLHVFFHLRHHLAHIETPLSDRLTSTERVSMMLIGVCVLLLLLAPALLSIDVVQLLSIFSNEILPW